MEFESVWPFIQQAFYIVLAAGIGFFSFRHIIGYLKIRVQKSVQIAKHSSQASTIARYDSAHDLLADMEKGLEFSLHNIKQACIARGVEPMKDVGFNTTLENYQKVISYREKFESSPMFMIADNLFWPAAKQLMIHTPKMIKEMVSFFG